MADNFRIELESGGFFDLRTAGDERLADGTDNGTHTDVMGIMVVTDTIATDKIGLILHRTSPSKNLPSILTTLRPVGYDNYGIVLKAVCIAAPNGESQVVAGEQKESDAAVFNDGMGRARLIVTVFTAITEQVVLVVKILSSGTPVDEIMAIQVG